MTFYDSPVSCILIAAQILLFKYVICTIMCAPKSINTEYELLAARIRPVANIIFFWNYVLLKFFLKIQRKIILLNIVIAVGISHGFVSQMLGGMLEESVTCAF